MPVSNTALTCAASILTECPFKICSEVMELGTINRTEILNGLFNLSIKKLLSNTLLVCQSETNLTDKSHVTQPQT